MSVSTISVGGSNVTLVALPSYPGPRSVEFNVKDTVATMLSPFTGQVQTQQWPGADMLSGTFTLPGMTKAQAATWVAFLMQLRGMTRVFQIGDPMYQTPTGTPSGTPVAGAGNLAMSQSLITTGWTASRSGLLLPGDYIQIGYRLHRVLDTVNSDSSGNATFEIWPSLREVVPTSTSIVTSNTKGLFRLAGNDRKFSFDITQLTHMSIAFQEYR
jgi:hypothetical protein